MNPTMKPFLMPLKVAASSLAVGLLIASLAFPAMAQAPANITPQGDVDPLPRASAESVGVSSERLDRLGALLQGDIESGRLPGAVVAVARRGKLIYYRAYGYLDPVAKTRMPRNAIFAIAAMTKPMVAVTALSLVEQGRVLIDDPVTKYLPSLARMPVALPAKDPTDMSLQKTVPAARPPSIQDLLRHTAGMTYGNRGESELYKAYPQSSNAAARAMNGDEFIAKLATLPLYSQPGSKWDYGLSFDVLGLTVEKVSGQKLGAFMNDRLFKPLGMGDTGFVVPADKASRFARALAADPTTTQAQSLPDMMMPPLFDCGGGCAVSTAADYLRFAQMLLNKGALGDKQILSKATVEYMTADQLGPDIDESVLRHYPNINGYGFGLGVAVRRSTGGPAVMGTPGSFTWAGSNGTNFWVDPKEELAVVFMAHTPGALAFHYRQIVNTLVLQSLVN
ncbi:serine hydrolase domain-containing protein [soil metagenome]